MKKILISIIFIFMLASCSKIDFDPTNAKIRYLLTGDKK